MKVETFLFGTIEIDPDTLISFPDGLLGFEKCTRFKLVHEAEHGEQPASFTLQSVDNSSLALQIIDPLALGFHYELELTTEEAAKLQLADPKEAAVMLAIYKHGEEKGIGANIRAPILLNPSKRLGIQKVMQEVKPSVTLTNLSTAVA